MKRTDIGFIALVVAIFLPFFLIDSVYEWYKAFNAAHGMIMSFFKFAILATLGAIGYAGSTVKLNNIYPPARRQLWKREFCHP